MLMASARIYHYSLFVHSFKNWLIAKGWADIYLSN